MKELQSALGAEGLDECVCLVCDRLGLRRESRRKDGSDWRFVVKLRECLGEPLTIYQNYRAPPHVDGLESVMVLPRGVHCYIDKNGCPNARMSVCKTCDDSICADRLPKFAVANGCFIGRLPKPLRRLTIPERFMTQLASIGAMARVMRGGRHHIRSHCVAFDCTPGPPVSLLPRPVTK
ncbi:hypothetical protein GQ600_9937 [Phytophthora cactorum]|nr:hypothetical protein GQ600_9937 [Phytophthora cactorum]